MLHERDRAIDLVDVDLPGARNQARSIKRYELQLVDENDLAVKRPVSIAPSQRNLLIGQPSGFVYDHNLLHLTPTELSFRQKRNLIP